MSHWNASRGGHAPGHLREMFWTYVESGEVPVEMLYEPTIAGPDPARWLRGQLWNCSDIMPSNGCEELDLPAGSTYARAVRDTR